MFRDEHALAEQDVVHRPVEARLAAVDGEIRRREVDADQLDALRDQPLRRRHAEAGMLVVARGIEVLGPAGVEQHDVVRSQRRLRRLEERRLDDLVRLAR